MFSVFVIYRLKDFIPGFIVLLFSLTEFLNNVGIGILVNRPFISLLMDNRTINVGNFHGFIFRRETNKILFTFYTS